MTLMVSHVKLGRVLLVTYLTRQYQTSLGEATELRVMIKRGLTLSARGPGGMGPGPLAANKRHCHTPVTRQVDVGQVRSCQVRVHKDPCINDPKSD